MMYLTWQAKLFGLTKTRAFLVAFLLSCIVLLFPWALRTGTLVWWILSVILLVIFGALYPTKQIDKDKSKNNPIDMDSEPMVSVENNDIQEFIDQTVSAQESIPKSNKDDEWIEKTKGDDKLVINAQEDNEDNELIEETKKSHEQLGEINEDLINNMAILVQTELNIETFVTKASSTMVLSGKHRRKRTLKRNTSMLRTGFRRAVYSQAEKEEASFLVPKCFHNRRLLRRRNSFYSGRFTILPIVETKASLLDKPSNGQDNGISLEELIDLGFKAKNIANFELAAFYFSRALALDPKPDIAFYLIIDCYWLWNNLGERNYALTQLDEYVITYLPRFNSELRYQFDAWMTREDIHKD